MADTRRTLDAFLNASTGLFKDNTAGDITAQDLRDFVLSVPVALSIQTIGDGDVTDQGDYNDFQAVNGVLYAIDIADIMTLADDNNTRVIFPATPAEGDTFGFFVKTQSDQAGSFAQAPGYCVEPADATVINNVAVTAQTIGGSKWSLWLESECLIFRYVDATVGWQVVHDGRIMHKAVIVRAGAAHELTTAAVSYVMQVDTAIIDNAALFKSATYSLRPKRSSDYLASGDAVLASVPDAVRLLAKMYSDGEDSPPGDFIDLGFTYSSYATPATAKARAQHESVALTQAHIVVVHGEHTNGSPLNTSTGVGYRPRLCLLEQR